MFTGDAREHDDAALAGYPADELCLRQTHGEATSVRQAGTYCYANTLLTRTAVL